MKRQELLEWATVFDNLYGTPRPAVETALSKGKDVLFNIDWQGTQQLREKGARRRRQRLHSPAVIARIGEAPARQRAVFK
jgi:guanylate kinase